MNFDPHVELLRYLGRDGAYATDSQPLWIARLACVNGDTINCRADCWHGFVKPNAPLDDALQWAERLGWKIVVKDGGKGSSYWRPPASEHMPGLRVVEGVPLSVPALEGLPFEA